MLSVARGFAHDAVGATLEATLDRPCERLHAPRCERGRDDRERPDGQGPEGHFIVLPHRAADVMPLALVARSGLTLVERVRAR